MDFIEKINPPPQFSFYRLPKNKNTPSLGFKGNSVTARRVRVGFRFLFIARFSGGCKKGVFMNKKHGFCLVLVCLLTFGLVFTACDKDDGNKNNNNTNVPEIVSKWLNEDDFGDGPEPYQEFRFYNDGTYLIYQPFMKELVVEEGTYTIEEEPFVNGTVYTIIPTYYYYEAFFGSDDPPENQIVLNGTDKSIGTVRQTNSGEVILDVLSWHFGHKTSPGTIVTKPYTKQ
jgi:hypothetical protein